MDTKIFVQDFYDDYSIQQKATIKAEIEILKEEKEKIEKALQETKNVVVVELQSLQNELESTKTEINNYNSSITDLEDKKTLLQNEIDPILYEKGNLINEIETLKEQIQNTEKAHNVELSSLKDSINKQLNIKSEVELSYTKIVEELEKEVNRKIKEKADLDVYINELRKYEKVSNARFIAEVQKITDKAGLKINLFNEVKKHIR